MSVKASTGPTPGIEMRHPVGLSESSIGGDHLGQALVEEAGAEAVPVEGTT